MINENILLIVLLIIFVITFIISFIAYFCAQRTKIDCIWYGLVIYMIQFIVFISYINVCIEIIINKQETKDLKIMFSGIIFLVHLLYHQLLDLLNHQMVSMDAGGGTVGVQCCMKDGPWGITYIKSSVGALDAPVITCIDYIK